MRGLIEPVARTHKLHGRQTSPGKRHAEYRRTFDVPAIAATEHRRRKAAGTLPYDLSEIWLRTLTIDCTASAAPWWQTFPVYKSHDNRRVVFQWERIPDEPERVYTSPLQEARRYVRILENDPAVTTRADLAREMGVSRARVTQTTNLLRLHSEVQEKLLKLEDQRAIRFFSERRLRPLIQIEDPRRQLREFERMLAQIPG